MTDTERLLANPPRFEIKSIGGWQRLSEIKIQVGDFAFTLAELTAQILDRETSPEVRKRIEDAAEAFAALPAEFQSEFLSFIRRRRQRRRKTQTE